jgi:hypothetical protein
MIVVLTSFRPELVCACYPTVPLHRLRVCCDFINWLWHLDDLSDNMDAKDTVAIKDEIVNTYLNPDTFNPKTLVGDLTKRFVRPAQRLTGLTIRFSL